MYRPGGGYTDEYVYNLQRAVARYVQVPHRFVCLTDQRLKCETIPLVTRWPGWWTKLELFRPRLFDGPVVYLDLDTVLVSDITDIVTEAYDFACATNWKGGGAHISSAVMAWNGLLDLSHIFTSFRLEMRREYETWQFWGDQGHVQRFLGRPFEDLLARWPKRIVHTKTHIWNSRRATPAAAPAGASIVCFSGKPRPHELDQQNPLYRAWSAK